MPRKVRIYSPTFAYHIINRGNNRCVLFKEPRDYQYFLQMLKELKNDYAFDVYHYCLMTNHIHLLMQFHYPDGFQKVPQRLNLLYAKYFSRIYDHVGHVFQDRFRSIPVEDNIYLMECGRYIERNPVKARMVKSPGQYRWSSYGFYGFGKENNVITTNPLYKDLSLNPIECQKHYRTFVETDRPYDNVIEKELFGRGKVAP